jgi:carnitine O-acetyltransferase
MLTLQTREKLVQLSAKNRETFESISTSLLCLCLDAHTLPSIPTSDPLAVPSVDAQMRNCAAGISGGRNRWLDKSIGLIVETNGRAGLAGEHSPIDALIPNIMMEYIQAVPVDTASFAAETTAAAGSGWKREDWVVDESIKREIVECEGRNKKLIEDSNASELWWAEYGVDWIKKSGRWRST